MDFKNHEGYVQPSSENSACLRLQWYGSEPHRYSEEQRSGNLFKNFRTYGSAVGMISLN